MQAPQLVKRADRAAGANSSAADRTGKGTTDLRRWRPNGASGLMATFSKPSGGLPQAGKRVLTPRAALLTRGPRPRPQLRLCKFLHHCRCAGAPDDLDMQYRAEQEAEALRYSVAVHADVMRDRKQPNSRSARLCPAISSCCEPEISFPPMASYWSRRIFSSTNPS